MIRKKSMRRVEDMENGANSLERMSSVEGGRGIRGEGRSRELVRGEQSRSMYSVGGGMRVWVYLWW